MTTLPVTPVVRPADLAGQSNGRLAASLLVTLPAVPLGSPDVRLHHTTARCFDAMRTHAARDGVTLRPTSFYDGYRPYDKQVELFLARHTTTPLAGQPTSQWQGVTYWLKVGAAQAAVPGTSNHGWGLAIDILLDAGGTVLAWLLAHAAAYGFSWEIQSEAWHVRMVTGDELPAAVLAYEGELDMTKDEVVAAVLEAFNKVPAKWASSGVGQTAAEHDRTVPSARAMWEYTMEAAVWGSPEAPPVAVALDAAAVDAIKSAITDIVGAAVDAAIARAFAAAGAAVTPPA